MNGATEDLATVMRSSERLEIKLEQERRDKTVRRLMELTKTALSDKDATSIPEDVLENLYDNEPGMWGHFVRGAPSMLLRKSQPTKNLANGSMGWQDSLTFDPEPPPEILAAVSAGHYQEVTLYEPPFLYQHRATASRRRHGGWHPEPGPVLVFVPAAVAAWPSVAAALPLG